MDIKKVSGIDLENDFKWLKANDCGCCHHSIYDTDNNNMYILMGWHKSDGKWEIAVKIGMQSFNNAMQCDLDVDFEMPYDKETGEVYDTLQIVGENENWDKLAEQLNDEAVKVVKFQIEQEV